MKYIYESDFEENIIDMIKNLGFEYYSGSEIREQFQSMNSNRNVVITEILYKALRKINTKANDKAIDEAVKSILDLKELNYIDKNKTFQKYLSFGIEVNYFDNENKSTYIKLVDYKNIDNNYFWVVNQLSIKDVEDKRPDVIIYLNGLPVVVMELKNPVKDDETIDEAYTQIKNYMENWISNLFYYNAFCVITDGVHAEVGTITADKTRFIAWKRESEDIDVIKKNSDINQQYKTLINGMLQKERFLNILHYFVFYIESNEKAKIKILAAYHQYFAVNKAVEKIKEAYNKKSRKAGIVWHTTGSGKSFTMLMAAKVISQNLYNPTIVIITDRTDLDDQLFLTFSSARSTYLNNTPEKIESRQDLIKRLKGINSGGIIFTTLQKFEQYDEALSERSNIVLMVDEAHRSHDLEKSKIKDGQIKYNMSKYINDAFPNAIKIGFTGTPIESDDRNTKDVFGDYIDCYDMTQAVEDDVTVPIYYEGRVNHLKLDEEMLKKADEEYTMMLENNEATEEAIEKSKKELSKMDAILGADDVIDSLCKDIIAHYEKRKNVLIGKAFIVAYSRTIGIKIYKKILELKPDWENMIKPVMTTSNKDPVEWGKMLGSKSHRDNLAKEFKDKTSNFKIAVVVSMWLTGFDVPPLDTMYIYKPIANHDLMQTISRVNRVCKDKDAGLLVDYIGIADNLKKAMKDYTKRDIDNYGDMDIAKMALPKFKEALEYIRNIFKDIDYSSFYTCSSSERMDIILKLSDHISSLEEAGKNDFFDKAVQLMKAEKLCRSIITREESVETALYESVKVIINKIENHQKLSIKDINQRINKILENSIQSEGIMNIFEGNEDSKEFSLFDKKYLKSIANMKYKNIALEVLNKLLNDKIKATLKVNIIQSGIFSDRIKKIMERYNNNAIDNIEVIDELLNLSDDLDNIEKEANDLGLTNEEKAMYDAMLIPINSDYNKEEIKTMAKELAVIIEKNSEDIDWQSKESTRSKMKMDIKRFLKMHKYPKEFENTALDNILRQAENYEILKYS
ncbi:type I restriction endonuclease subunit R [Brachyspira hyodysenteriae]|uniref:type I restriction endonuclease subunit R n=1 Tax=Brachyspira hyodysenteriae TaxID=159 RepID=UPI00063D9708|nr:type I restriction endonuclease subunit R [Brachyspira hyodysenteriae]KLI17221.1 type I deoxyribonuclease HsdR [Brachyspira hyodysenteriae]MBT8719404.1 type I restriction endonuclease subunit R [Brachyspira hyodysenteriae]MBT8729646.1 type I restriction endonuclease subunit R [Brachyspira hyodysenteriae]MBT8732235.1 type I restriction endonuclease subunit R [Brachyspira hyodysenteriae]MBT8734818.1 type I restriction endonuclease subunit R [Brachyspira hyodysenteriae]